MPKRSHKKGLLALPLLLLPFILSWIMYFVGARKNESIPQKRAMPKATGSVHLGVLLPEQELYAK